MAYFEKGVPLNDGNVVVISSIHQGYFKPQDSTELMYSYFSDGVSVPSSSIDLSSYCPTNANVIADNLIRQVFGVSGNPLTPEYRESAEFVEIMTTFNNNVNWLWGSREKGGLFLTKHDSTHYSIYGVSGKYIINDIYVYDLFGGVYHTLEELSDCIFTVNDNYMFDENNRFQLQLLLRRHDTTPERYVIEVSDYFTTLDNVLIYTAPYFAYNWSSVIDTFGFEDTGLLMDPTPIRIFRGYSPEYLWSNRDISTLTYEDGDWSGENLVDVDGAGNSGYGGGDGDFNNNSDDVGESNGSDITNDVLTSGFITLYNPTLTNLKSFNNFLFTDITDSIAEQIKRLQTNPLDYVVNISMCHFNPATTTSDYIRFAGISSGVTAPIIDNQFITKYLGSVSLSEYFGTFLDYNPYTQCELYLPYIGVVPIDIDDVMGGTISIYYTIDLLTGSCIAQIKTNRHKRATADSSINSILYEFQGNCFLNVPISATSWQGTYQSIIQGISGIGSAIGGNVLGGAGQIASAVISEKVSCQRSGALQPAHGFMGKQYPYFILSRPIQNLPYNFKGFEGYTSNVRDRVKNLSGYTEIDTDTIWSDNFGHATQEECKMIKDIMNGGVYL